MGALMHMKDNLFLLVEQYGNSSMAVLLILEFIGFPVPGEPLMTFLGFITRKVEGSLFLALFFSVIGTNIGSTIAYYLGYKFGEPLLHKYGKYMFIDDAKIQKTKEIMLKYERTILLFNRYIPGVRHVVPYLCGITKLEFKKFTGYSFLGSVIWCGSFILTGYILGDKWNKLQEYMDSTIWIIAIVAIFIIVVVKFFRRFCVEIFLFVGGLLGYIYMLINTVLSTDESKRWFYDLYFRNELSFIINKPVTLILSVVTEIGNWYVYLFSIILVLIYCYKNKWTKKFPLLITANLLLSYGIGTLLKEIFHRTRPEVEHFASATGYSFPSLHSMNSTAFYILFAYFIFAVVKNKYIKTAIIVFFVAIFLTVSFSRIYLGVHYESDVIAGISAGMVLSSVFAFVMKLNGLLDPGRYIKSFSRTI